jgi:pimeloyl-ACP methyl ester carboxylesterase
MCALALAFLLRPSWVLDQQVHLGLWSAGAVSREVAVDGFHVHFYELAPRGGAGTPLVLVHGLGSRAEDWSRLMPSLAAAGFHVYAPDLLGYGRSSRPADGDFSIATEERVLFDWMEKLHLGKVDLVGWSMGGWVAMSLALDHAEAVDRLAVFDSAGTYFPAEIPPGLFTPDDVEGVQRLVNVLEPAPLDVPRFYAVDSLRRLRANAWVVNRSLASMVGGQYLLDFRLHMLRQPMLIVWGGSDRLTPPAVGEAMHRAVRQSVYRVVEGCGHLAPAECSGPFLEETIGFFRAQPPWPPGEKTLPKQR